MPNKLLHYHQPVPANVSIHGITEKHCRQALTLHVFLFSSKCEWMYDATCDFRFSDPLMALYVVGFVHSALFPIDGHVCNVASMKDPLGHASAGPPSLSRLPSLCHGATTNPPSLSRLPSLCHGAVACHIKRDVTGDVHSYHLPMLQPVAVVTAPVCAGNLVHLTIPPPHTDPHKSEQAHCSVKLHLHCRDIPSCDYSIIIVCAQQLQETP